MKVKTPYYDFAILISLLGFCFTLVGFIIHCITNNYFVLIIGVIMIVLPIFSINTFICKIPPKSVTFGELKTFRDLVKCVADD